MAAQNFKQTFGITLGLALVLILVMTSYANSNNIKNTPWPPVVYKCPDFWIDASEKQDGSKCENKNNIGTCSTVNFNSSNFANNTSIKSKRDWAKSCGVSWEGITN